MSDSNTSNFLRQCAGPIPRRGFMQMGLAGFASLSLPGVLRMRAESPAQNKKERTAIIMVFLPGGLSHIDSYDPKSDVGSEYRGPFQTIPTKVDPI